MKWERSSAECIFVHSETHQGPRKGKQAVMDRLPTWWDSHARQTSTYGPGPSIRRQPNCTRGRRSPTVLASRVVIAANVKEELP